MDETSPGSDKKPSEKRFENCDYNLENNRPVSK